MKNIQERKLSMYEVVRDLLNSTEQSIIDLMPQMETYKTNLMENINLLSNVGGTQKLNRKGIVDSKDLFKSNLIFRATDVSRRVQGYAVNSNDLVLLKEVKYSSASMERLADNILVIVSRIIYDRAKAHLSELATYGVDGTVLTDLDKAITDYDATLPRPRTGIVTKKVATVNLKQLFSATDLLLKNQIDVLVGIVKDSYPDFYANYVGSRKIVNPASHPLAVRCRVLDSLGAPVAGVLALVVENGKTYKTKTKGGFYIKSLAAGTYMFQFSKEGYLGKEVPVSVATGERTDVTVTLEAGAFELGKAS